MCGGGRGGGGGKGGNMFRYMTSKMKIYNIVKNYFLFFKCVWGGRGGEGGERRGGGGGSGGRHAKKIFLHQNNNKQCTFSYLKRYGTDSYL